MRIDFDFLDLEAFLAVMETGGFHIAGARLNMSQSSVTRRVKKLEEALGTQLFERTTRDVRPTLAAKRLRLRAEAILQDAQETTRAMRDETAAFAHQRAQTVTLATIPTVVRGLVAPALHDLRAGGGVVRVRLIDLAANEVAEAVAQGEADFGICSLPMVEPVTDFTLLFSEPLVLAMRQDHPLAEKQSLNWRDLEGEALVLPARGTGNRLMIDEALARSETPVRWRYEVGRSSTALDLVAQGIGVAPLPEMAVRSSKGQGLCARALRAPDVSRPIGLLSRVGQVYRPPVAALREALMARGAALRSNGDAG